jgi:hypothetical protein
MLSNRDLLAKTLQAEAGNQGLGGMMAVGSVIMNRVGSGQNLRDIILAPGQFSAWNSVTGYAGGEQGQDMEAIKPSKDAYAAADAILSGGYADITGGATHYYNPDISQPKWGASAGGDWTKIGAHLFGKADAPKRGKPTMDGQRTMPMQAQPTAQQMQQTQRQPRGLMDFLRDPRTRQAFASLDRSGMFEGIAEQAGRDVERQEQQLLKQQQQREQQQMQNRTAQYLRTQPGGEPYARAIESGIDARMVYEQYVQQMNKGGISQQDINKMVVDARKEFTGLKPVKDFADVGFAYSRVVRSADDPSPAGDLALIFNFMKVLDPGSVVREGEFATAQNAGGVDERVRSLYNQVREGTRLTETQRADFVDRAGRLYGGAQEQYQSIADQYSEFARRAGLDPSLVIPDFGFKGTIPEKPLILQVPPNPDENKFPTASDWKNHWQNVMTEDDRKAYLEG